MADDKDLTMPQGVPSTMRPKMTTPITPTSSGDAPSFPRPTGTSFNKNSPAYQSAVGSTQSNKKFVPGGTFSGDKWVEK